MSGDGVHNPANMAPALEAIEANRVLINVVQATVADIHTDIEVVDANVVDIHGDLEVVDANVDLIREVTDGLPTLTEAHGSTTTTVLNTEYALFAVGAPIGVFRPLMVAVNFLYQQVAETVILRKYRRDVDGGVWTEFDQTPPFVGVIHPRGVKIELGPNRYGIRLTIERLAGAARAYPWAAFYEI